MKCFILLLNVIIPVFLLFHRSNHLISVTRTNRKTSPGFAESLFNFLKSFFFFFFFFFLSGFSFTDTDNSQDSRGREGTILFHSTTSTHSRTFRHLFATLQVRWLSHIFNRNACIYQTATDDIYHLIELLFHWLMMWCWFSFDCLLIWL